MKLESMQKPEHKGISEKYQASVQVRENRRQALI